MVLNALNIFIFFLRVFAILLSIIFINYFVTRVFICCRAFRSLFPFKKVCYAFRKETCFELAYVIFNLFLGDVVYYWGDEIGLIKPLNIPAVAEDGLRSIFNEGIDLPPSVDDEWVCILYTRCFVRFSDDKLWAWNFFQILMSFRLCVRHEWVAR